MNMLKLAVSVVAVALAFVPGAFISGASVSGVFSGAQAASLSGENEAGVVRKGLRRTEKIKRWRHRARPQCVLRCDDITYRGYRRHRESIDSWFPPVSVVAAPFVGSKCATADACYLRNPHGDGYCGCDPDGCCQYLSTYYGRCNPCE